jgi:hypothetical protein
MKKIIFIGDVYVAVALRGLRLKVLEHSDSVLHELVLQKGNPAQLLYSVQCYQPSIMSKISLFLLYFLCMYGYGYGSYPYLFYTVEALATWIISRDMRNVAVNLSW